MSNLFSFEDKFAQRVWDVRGGKKESTFIALLNIASDIENPIPLGRGDPDLPTPEHIIEATEKALREGKTKYTSPPGLEELRVGISEKLKSENDLDYDPEDEIVVTSGTQEAINVIFQSLLNPGEEIILPSPYYAAYRQSISAAGGIPKLVPTYLEEDFIVRPEDIGDAIDDKTKAIILVSPSNPTGAVIDEDSVKEIAEIALQEDLIVISDELYEKIVFGDTEVTSVAGLPDMWDRTITVNGFSKAYNMTGMRVGYFAAPAEFVNEAVELRHMSSICAPTLSQWAALEAVRGSDKCVEENLEIYRKRRNILLEGLSNYDIPSNNPKGAFFIFADIRETGLTSFEFCKRFLREKHVLVFPGSQYGPSGEGFIRVSFLAPSDKLDEAVNRLGSFYEELSNS